MFSSIILYFWKKYTSHLSMASLNYLLNIISQISFAAFFLFNFLMFSHSNSNFLSSNAFSITSSAFSSFLSHTAKPFSSKNSAFSSSCPGIGFIASIGVSETIASVDVIPPWLCYN